jgi:uncharacterized protein DUF5309
MATVTGAMTTTNVSSDQLAIDLGDRIKLLDAEVNPLAIFTKRARNSKTVATKFGWLEESNKARFDTVNGAVAGTTATSIVATNGSYYQQWDQILITRTGEQMRVDGVAGNTLTVTRGIGSTAAALLNLDEIYIIGSAQPENDTSKPARSDVPAKVTNYTQIFRTPFEASNSLIASGYQVSPAEWPRQVRNKGIEHAKDIELSFLLGRKSLTTPGATEDRSTGGVLSFITTNQTDAGGDLSEAEFNAAMLQQSRYSGNRGKLALASGVGVGALNKFPASKQQTRSDETTYGMNVTQYTSPFGSLNLVYHRLLEGTKYSGYIIIVDMDEVAYRWLGNDEMSRDTQVLTNRQPRDQDGRKDEFLSEVGLEFGNQRKHAVITGITS